MTLNRLVGILLVILLPVSVFPQDTLTTKKKSKPRVYLDASAGISIPLGNYANDDPENEATGYASPGFFLQAHADWMGKSDFGIAFQLGYQNNGLQDTAKTVIPYGSDEPYGSGSWSNLYILAGPVFLKQVKKLSIDAKVLGGFIIASCPVFKTKNPENKMTEGGTGTGWAIGVSFGAGYRISEHVALKGTIGYMAGFPKVDRQYGAAIIGIDPLSGHYIYSAPIDIVIKKTVSSLNAGIGVIYEF